MTVVVERETSARKGDAERRVLARKGRKKGPHGHRESRPSCREYSGSRAGGRKKVSRFTKYGNHEAPLPEHGRKGLVCMKKRCLNPHWMANTGAKGIPSPDKKGRGVLIGSPDTGKKRGGLHIAAIRQAAVGEHSCLKKTRAEGAWGCPRSEQKGKETRARPKPKRLSEKVTEKPSRRNGEQNPSVEGGDPDALMQRSQYPETDVLPTRGKGDLGCLKGQCVARVLVVREGQSTMGVGRPSN